MKLDGYPLRAGVHSETSGLRNVLEYVGCKLPHTQRPPSEAWVLGLGGGIGGGCLVHALAPSGPGGDGAPHWVVLGFRNAWHKWRGEFAEAVCTRLLVPLEVRETASSKMAQAQLANVLGEGLPAWITCDEATLHWTPPPPVFARAFVYGVVVFGMSETAAYVDDRSHQGFEVPLPELASARAAIGLHQHRMVILRQPSRRLDLTEAVLDAVVQCRDDALKPAQPHLGPAAWQHWSRVIADSKEKTGWLYQLARPQDVVWALRTAYQQLDGTSEGAGLRELYAEFLSEAALVVPQKAGAWHTAATHFREAGALWRRFGEALLPDDAATLRDIKALILRSHKLRRERGGSAHHELRTAHDKLAQSHLLPLHWDRRTVRERFEGFAALLQRIHDVEMAAFKLL
jgi:hypothetical protein